MTLDAETLDLMADAAPSADMFSMGVDAYTRFGKSAFEGKPVMLARHALSKTVIQAFGTGPSGQTVTRVIRA